MGHLPVYKTILLSTIISVSLLAGCGSSPPVRMYTLNSLTSTKPVDGIIKKDILVVRVGPIEIPDYLDRPHIVTRTTRNELHIAEFEQWGGPLASDINRSLVENISSILDGSNIAIVPWRTYVHGAYKIPTGVERFDVTPGKAVVLKARWAVIGRDNTSPQSVRESLISTPLKGSSYEEMVAAMSEALVGLSREMAADIKALAEAGQEKTAKGSK